MKSILPLALLLLSACQYNFDIVQPVDHAGMIGSKAPLTVVLAPVEYRFQAAEGRLVIEIHNTATEELQIDGQRSVVVDPTGLVHPIASQLIPKSAFLKLILPPMHYDRGPLECLPVIVGADETSPTRQATAPATQPVYVDVLDNPADWDWHGDDSVRVELTILRGSESFTHKFEFHRHKM